MSKNKSALSWGFMHPPQKYHTGPFCPSNSIFWLQKGTLASTALTETLRKFGQSLKQCGR